MREIAKFLFEAGMLRKTPRSGFQFLGSGSESVAEHALMTLFIGYALGQLEGDIDLLKILKLCLFHDLPEARTGDMNYVNKKYVSVDEDKAVKDLASPLPFGDDLRDLFREFKERKSREARIAHDADQLSMIVRLKECGDLGNKYTDQWIAFILKRLDTEKAKELAEGILASDSTDWWFEDKSDWWVNGEKK